MLFNSLSYLAFLPLLFLVFWGSPVVCRKPLLLLGSAVFYGFYLPAYLLILAGLVLIHYFGARAIESAPNLVRRKILLIGCVSLSLGFLFAFKYLPWLGGFKGWVLPLGLSFHALQTIAYDVDVYRGRARAESNLLDFALFVVFFAQAVAGPIERAEHFLPQLRRSPKFRIVAMRTGAALIALGFVKKCLIADNLAPIADEAFQNIHSASAGDILAGALAFGIQIYNDFSGYSDIAVGSAMLFGLNLTPNFRAPYLAGSLSDFWRRWHISLSSWFRDYIYIPMGGKRVGKTRQILAIFCVFVLSGLWHGASVTFALWGLWHWAFYIPGILIGGSLDRMPAWTRAPRAWISHAMTLAVVTLGWIFFRARSVAEVMAAFSQLHSGHWAFHRMIVHGQALVALAALSFALDGLQMTLGERPWALRPVWIRWGMAYAAIVALFWFGRFQGNEFIYFQF